MKGLWARRGLRLFCAAAAVAAVAAGGTYATTSLTASATATNTIQACVKDNGDVRIVATAADCRTPEHAISWNVAGPVGPAGAPGAPGAAGANGKDGASVVSSPASAVDCPNGGTKFVVGTAAPTFACNGANGKDGKDGADGTSVTSIDGLNGLTCTTNGQTGTVSVASGSGGAISLTCSAGGGSGGGTGCTPQGVANGTLDCNGNLTCNPGFANADNDPSNGCEMNVGSDPNNCGAPGIHVQPLPHATTGCINGRPALIACDPGWIDANGNPADGCEVSCTHDNGLGTTYSDCSDPQGTPGDASTYTSHMALLAAAAGSQFGPGQQVGVDQCGGAGVVRANLGNGIGVWAFTGPAAGHVVLTNNGVTCPATTDPTWR